MNLDADDLDEEDEDEIQDELGAEWRPHLERLDAHMEDLAAPDKGGVAACPFARQAKRNGNMRVSVSETLDQVSWTKLSDPSDAIHVHIWTAPGAMPYADFRQWLAEHNANPFGQWVHAYHPADPDLPAVAHWIRGANVALIKTCQLAQLQRASEWLRPQGYYRTREGIMRDVLRRERAYLDDRRFEAGGFTPSEVAALAAYHHGILH